MTPYGVITAGFAVVLGAMLAAQLLGMAGRWPLRPLGTVVHTVLRHRAGRWFVLVLWLWVGFHFLAR
ncbi:MAG: DUF6186 family protein [Actinomycetota bacterium]|nr:DUF6186 family protein [Actinomycetota bacterium]